MPYPFLENYNFFGEDPETMESGFKKPKPFLDQKTIPMQSRPLDQGMSTMPGDQPNFRGAMPPQRQMTPPTQLPPQRPPITTQGAPPKPFRPPMPKNVEGPFDTQNRVQGPISNAYQQKVLEPTEGRGEYKPSWQRRLGAVGMGMLTGPYGAQEFLNRPRNAEAFERSQRLGELEKGAEEERGRSDEQWNRQQEQRTSDQMDRRLDIDEKNKDSLAASRASRDEINRLRYENPGYEIKMIPGGKVTLFDPSGRRPPIETPVASGTMSKEDELEQEQKNATERIRLQGRVQAELTNLRAKHGVSLAEIQSRLNIMENDAEASTPNWEFLKPRGGKVHMVDTNNPTKPPIKLEIDSDTFSFEQEEALRSISTTSEAQYTGFDKDGNPTGVRRTTTRGPAKPPQAPTMGPVAGANQSPVNPADVLRPGGPAPNTLNQAAQAPQAPAPRPAKLTDPKTGETYDTSEWSAEDIANAKAAGFK